MTERLVTRTAIPGAGFLQGGHVSDTVEIRINPRSWRSDDDQLIPCMLGVEYEVFQTVMDVLRPQFGHNETAEVAAICGRRNQRLDVVKRDFCSL
jgi:hypothetical protein